MSPAVQTDMIFTVLSTTSDFSKMNCELPLGITAGRRYRNSECVMMNYNNYNDT